jgi:hypothetical protein
MRVCGTGRQAINDFPPYASTNHRTCKLYTSISALTKARSPSMLRSPSSRPRHRSRRRGRALRGMAALLLSASSRRRQAHSAARVGGLWEERRQTYIHAYTQPQHPPKKAHAPRARRRSAACMALIFPALSTQGGFTPARCSVSMKRWDVRSSKYWPGSVFE